MSRYKDYGRGELETLESGHRRVGQDWRFRSVLVDTLTGDVVAMQTTNRDGKITKVEHKETLPLKSLPELMLMLSGIEGLRKVTISDSKGLVWFDRWDNGYNRAVIPHNRNQVSDHFKSVGDIMFARWGFKTGDEAKGHTAYSNKPS